MSEKMNHQSNTAASAPYALFGSRLTEACRLGKLSNSRLAKACSVDPSHISRFKSGLRIPRSNPQLTETICRVCFDHIKEQNALSELASRIGTGETSEKKLFPVFCEWLCNFTSSDQTTAMSIFYSISQYCPPSSVPKAPEKKWIKALAEADDEFFLGMEGVQQASLQFLAKVLEKGGKELLLYSDYPIDWLGMDEDFRMKWLSLMSACVQKKIKITIIHNIDRNAAEMSNALKSWMPLYMSGAIEPYYCLRSGGERFYHTLFVSPGIAAVEGWQSSDDTSGGNFRLHTNEPYLTGFRDMFEGLKKDSRRLLRISYDPVQMSDEDKDKAHTLEAFPNIRFHLNDDSVIIERLTQPCISFILYHPLMLRAFSDLLA